MTNFRLRSDGTIISEADYRNMHPDTIFPQFFIPDDADPILESPSPATTIYQTAWKSGTEQDVLGNWIYSWTITDWTQEQIDAYNQSLVPPAVTMRQARLALLSNGHLATVDAAISSMQGLEGDAARITWDYSSSVERSTILVQQMQALLQLTDADIDQLFIFAATL